MKDSSWLLFFLLPKSPAIPRDENHYLTEWGCDLPATDSFSSDCVAPLDTLYLSRLDCRPSCLSRVVSASLVSTPVFLPHHLWGSCFGSYVVSLVIFCVVSMCVATPSDDYDIVFRYVCYASECALGDAPPSILGSWKGRNIFVPIGRWRKRSTIEYALVKVNDYFKGIDSASIFLGLGIDFLELGFTQLGSASSRFWEPRHYAFLERISYLFWVLDPCATEGAWYLLMFDFFFASSSSAFAIVLLVVLALVFLGISWSFHLLAVPCEMLIFVKKIAFKGQLFVIQLLEMLSRAIFYPHFRGQSFFQIYFNTYLCTGKLFSFWLKSVYIFTNEISYWFKAVVLPIGENKLWELDPDRNRRRHILVWIEVQTPTIQAKSPILSCFPNFKNPSFPSRFILSCRMSHT